MKKSFSKKIVIVLVLVGLFGVSAGYSQRVRPSQKGTVSQMVANTEIAIEYSRPSAKGRTLFGPDGIVKYKKIWMPGANEATNIKFSRDVLVSGKAIKAGRYSIWSIPDKNAWTIIFSEDWDQWHTRYPGKDKDALRISVKPKEGSHSELLSLYFPVVTSSSAVLHLHWGKTVIPIEIKLAKGR